MAGARKRGTGAAPVKRGRGRPRLPAGTATTTGPKLWVKMPEAMHAEIVAVAHAEAETPATIARQAIREYLDRRARR